ncbi:MAG: hypothetical protein GY797_37855, partial [Deltaproteobacteria bacterium]|nr:hypothetical protein [Deltaproteobacteria bacterium]
MLLHEAQKFLEVVNKRGKAEAELRRVYLKLCTNKELYLRAYANLYANEGAMTPGIDPDDTVDGMSMKRIDSIIEKLKRREYVWKPVRRTYILKRDGKSKRPLGMPGWTDKLLQEVIRMVLEAYYEPQFRDCSHGFRRGRGCHTALNTIARWSGVRWFIEGDIKGCFDNIDHDVVIRILRRKIKDNTFLQLIKDMLKAGYMEDWKFHQTYSGTPQGGIVSPLLMNIVLNELDTYIEDELIPKYTKGTKRKRNPEYQRLSDKIRWAQKKGNWKRANELRKLYVKIPYGTQNDPNFRRLWYVRYADDTLLGFIGTKQEAEAIKRELGNFLKGIHLEMSEEKTLITHAGKERARFLNYEIERHIKQTKKTKSWNGQKMCRRRSITSNLFFYMPDDVFKEWANKVTKEEKPRHRAELLYLSDYDIISMYEVELQGLINYYNRTHNQQRLRYLRYLWHTSLVKTLAAKYKTKATTIIKRYTKYTPDGNKVIGVEIQRKDKKPLRAVFGKKPITREKSIVIKDNVQTIYIVRNELITRLLATKCEL